MPKIDTVDRCPDSVDVVIVGAGPAGGTLGYNLAENGLTVLIIDAKRLPRYKACGGGITGRALNIIPFDIDAVVEDVAVTARISINGNMVANETTRSPVIGMVMRDRFDYHVINQAKLRGTIVRDGTAFMSVSGTAGNLSVHTSRGTVRSKIVVGADGANSRVARKLSLGINRKFMAAVAAEVFPTDHRLLDPFKHALHFDYGIVPRGYGWVFPKRGHLSMGALTVSNRVGEIKRCFRDYLASKLPKTNFHIRTQRGHSIPNGWACRGPFANEHGLLVGDATGITDPVTGEGIYYAVREARMASEVIRDHMLGNRSLTDYDRQLKAEFRQDLKCARRFADLLFKAPKISHHILTGHGKTIAKNHIKIITGEKSYRQLHREVFRVGNIIRSLFLPQA